MKRAIALGLFDGIHLGHRHVLNAALEEKQNGFVPCVFTFPAETAAYKQAEGYIYPTGLKEWLLRNECGIQEVFCPDFAKIRDMDGRTFAEKILAGRLEAGCVLCGRDFRFGRYAACDAEDLRKFGERFGFSVKIAADVQREGKTVSSGRIRRLLQEGRMECADLLLGGPYRLRDKVVHGARLGRTIGFPTANQIFHKGQLVPKFGVYASRTCVPDGTWYPSLTNIGIKPTVGYAGLPLAETYIKGYAGELYGETLQVCLYRFIRPERKFCSVDELMQQMQKDLEQCRI